MAIGSISNRDLFERIFKKVIPAIPLLIDFSKDWHKELVNADEIGAEIVDLTKEGIPLPYNGHSGKALKITLGANETKYLTLKFLGENEGYNSIMVGLYVTGDVKISSLGVFQINPNGVEFNLQNEWRFIWLRLTQWPNILKLSATNGGSVYIGEIRVGIKSDVVIVSSIPNITLDGTTTYTYYIYLPSYGNDQEGIARIHFIYAGDGTNAINVDIYVLSATDNTYKLLASYSRVSSTLGNIFFWFPIRNYQTPTNDIYFTNIKLVVSGYGTFWGFSGMLVKAKYHRELNGKVTASASEISTTPVTYVLIDNNGRGNRYKQLKANITIATGGGSVEILVNGKSIGTLTASGTVDLSFLEDVDIWKIEAKIAGDGTNASSIDIEGIELLGPYIVRR